MPLKKGFSVFRMFVFLLSGKKHLWTGGWRPSFWFWWQFLVSPPKAKPMQLVITWSDWKRAEDDTGDESKFFASVDELLTIALCFYFHKNTFECCGIDKSGWWLHELCVMVPETPLVENKISDKSQILKAEPQPRLILGFKLILIIITIDILPIHLVFFYFVFLGGRSRQIGSRPSTYAKDGNNQASQQRWMRLDS